MEAQLDRLPVSLRFHAERATGWRQFGSGMLHSLLLSEQNGPRQAVTLRWRILPHTTSDIDLLLAKQ